MFLGKRVSMGNRRRPIAMRMFWTGGSAGHPAQTGPRLDVPICPARRPQQQHRLAGRDQPLRPALPEGAAGLVEIERAEHLLAEVAIFTGGRFVLARSHCRASKQDRADEVGDDSANRRILGSRLRNNTRILRGVADRPGGESAAPGPYAPSLPGYPAPRRSGPEEGQVDSRGLM